MKYLSIIAAIMIYGNCSAQMSTPVFYDTTDKMFRFIDLSKIDTLTVWNYELDLTWRGYKSDTMKTPIGRISFFMKYPILNYWDQSRRPYLRYAIYDSKDSNTAAAVSRHIKSWSSCFPLQGGEKLLIGRFILVNSDVCSGEIDKNGDEVCRPFVNYIFSRVDPGKSETIEELIGQLPLKKAKLKFE